MSYCKEHGSKIENCDPDCDEINEPTVIMGVDLAKEIPLSAYPDTVCFNGIEYTRTSLTYDKKDVDELIGAVREMSATGCSESKAVDEAITVMRRIK